MKVKLNPMFENVSGQLGELVFRRVNGRTIASRKPITTGEPTENQSQHRERFKEAVAYGKLAMANVTLRNRYEALAESRNMPVFALTIADFFSVPVVNNIDITAYAGKAGDVIKVHASDDFGVAKVHLSITLEDGQEIENGDAQETAPGSGLWLYHTVTPVAAGTPVIVNVVVTDYPGSSVLDVRNKTL